MSTAIKLPLPVERALPRTELPLAPVAQLRAATAPSAPARVDRLAAALENAHSLGVSAVWTADHSASVELARLAGPHDHVLTGAEVTAFRLRSAFPRQLAASQVRCAVYERILRIGTPFDIYRWVNLLDLATVWPALMLPGGVHSEWRRALHAAGLR